MATDDDAQVFFESRGFEMRIEVRDLHAEYMAAGEPGRALFFVAGRTDQCVDLLRDGRVTAKHYASAETTSEALTEAMRRFASEQG